ncbi:MAG: hypothetical protein RR364_04995 [Lachnospiraceae bacterium]
MEQLRKQKEKKKRIKKTFTAREIRWDKLDNTAHLFPVIAGESMSNVYRISVILNEKINPEYLQQALNKVLFHFDIFNSRLQQGIFWYYFETNGKKAPKVVKEATYPCQYIVPNKNHSYLFRVTYYERRINLEVFHVLTDGMGGINFLRELTYQYLRLAHPELMEQLGDELSSSTSLNTEDSFVKNYKKSMSKGYKTQKAYIIKGERMKPTELGVIHGYLDVPTLKKVSRENGASINEYLVAVFIWSVYQECLRGMPSKQPITCAVPVNLRPYFNSVTTKNFFVMVTAVFEPKEDSYSFEEVLLAVTSGLREQITKEHLEQVFSYNVSNEKNIMLRAVPLFVKGIVIKYVYYTSARANTSTITNIGNIQVKEEYQPYIENFSAFLTKSRGQNIKGCICSYGDTLTFTFSSVLKDTNVQKAFFKKIAADGVPVRIESNGVYNESVQ